jgi:hypothetical protein
MRITVDNLMHQLLNPQVNFEIARVVAERMGLVQMPSPHMTVKYHHRQAVNRWRKPLSYTNRNKTA